MKCQIIKFCSNESKFTEDNAVHLSLPIISHLVIKLACLKSLEMVIKDDSLDYLRVYAFYNICSNK